MRDSVERGAKRALVRNHLKYGETVRLIKYTPSATGGIYRQRKRIYESPYEVQAKVARHPNQERMSSIGEASERNAEITIPVSFLRDLFGSSTALSETITTSDLMVFDNRVWRIVQASFTGRVGDDPLLMYILLREKLGAKEEDYE